MPHFLILGSDDERKNEFLKHFFGISLQKEWDDKVLMFETANQDQIFLAPWLCNFSDFNKNYIKLSTKAIIFNTEEGDLWTLENLVERNPEIQTLSFSQSSPFNATEIKKFFNLKDNEPNHAFLEMTMEI